MPKPVAAHAVKLTHGPGRIAAITVAFEPQAGGKLAEQFRDKLLAALQDQPEILAHIEVNQVPGYPDWMINFVGPCDEAALDKALHAVAASLGVTVSIKSSAQHHSPE